MERAFKTLIKILLAPCFLVAFIFVLLYECYAFLRDLISEVVEEGVDDLVDFFSKYFPRHTNCAESLNESKSEGGQTAG